LQSAVINIDINRHILIYPSGLKQSRMAQSKNESPVMLSAHYDRVKNSPGANDNSIAVFLLLRAAFVLEQKQNKNWLVVFTDKEELATGESLEEQGSFKLGEKLKSFGLEKVRIFNFDVCGRGGTFVLSTTTDILLQDSQRPNLQKIKDAITNLRNRALDGAYKLRMDKILLAPTPFSDEIGFLRAGLAAQTVTMLPDSEASAYEAVLRTRADFARLIISGAVKDPQERRNLPQTWRTLNGEADVPSLLTPEHFEKVVEFAVELCS